MLSFKRRKPLAPGTPPQAGGGAAAREWGLGVVVLGVALGVIGALVDEPLAAIARGADPEISAALARFSAAFSAERILAGAAILFVAAATASFGATGKRRRAAWEVLASRIAFLFVAVLVAALTVQALKLAIGRVQPWEAAPGLGAFSPLSHRAADASFPSGHAATAFASAAALALFAPRHALAFLVFALTIAVFRVAAGAHYPSDVLGGMVVGIVVTVGLARLAARTGHVFRRVDGALVRRGEGLVSAALRPRRRDGARARCV